LAQLIVEEEREDTGWEVEQGIPASLDPHHQIETGGVNFPCDQDLSNPEIVAKVTPGLISGQDLSRWEILTVACRQKADK
jgi:hypothetical protein